MPQCAFKNCENNHRNCKVTEGVSFFRFPTNPFRCAKWISIVARERGEEHYRPCKNSTICSIHFDKFDITGNTQRRRLVKTAIPKYQMHIEQKYMPADILTELSTSNMDALSTNLKDTRTIPAGSISNSPAACLSDLMPLQDTQREIYLKKQLIKSRKIIEIKTKKINNLKKVNKRLMKKNSSLKNSIKLLLKKQSDDDVIFLVTH